MDKQSIMMKSGTFVVTKIIKKTKSKFFKNVEVGHKLIFSVPLGYVGTSKSGSYAVYIRALNIDLGKTSDASFNQMSNSLRNFDLQEC